MRNNSSTKKLQHISVINEPIQPVEPGDVYAVIREEVSDKVLWQGGPFSDERAAHRAATRQLNRLKNRNFAERRTFV